MAIYITLLILGGVIVLAAQLYKVYMDSASAALTKKQETLDNTQRDQRMAELIVAKNKYDAAANALLAQASVITQPIPEEKSVNVF